MWMNSQSINARLEALQAAGIEYVQTSGAHYKVGPHGILYWPSTDRWRSHRDRVGGYGVQELIKAVREGSNRFRGAND